MKVIIRYWMGGAGVVTDQQVVLLRQRRMERKTQQTSAAMAGMSVRSAQKWQCGPLPSETGQERWWRTRTDPFDGVWEEEILPLLQGEAAGRLRATTIIEWLEEKFPGRFSASQLRMSRAMGCWASGAEQKCTTREFISQRNCPRQLFGTSVTEAGWRQAGRVSEDGFWRDLWVV